MANNNLLKNFIKTTLNKSDPGGLNWLNSLMAFLILFSAIFVPVYLVISENKSIAFFMLLYLLFLTIVILLIIFIVNKATLARLKKNLLKNNEKIVIHLFGSYFFNKNISLNNLVFSGILNEHLIDVIIALTANNNLYITPSVAYTKHSIIKIPLQDIKNIETSNLTISRQKVNDWSSASVAANTGIFIPTNQIQTELDVHLPINKIYLAFKTATSTYRLLLPANKKTFSFLKTISPNNIN